MKICPYCVEMILDDIKCRYYGRQLNTGENITDEQGRNLKMNHYHLFNTKTVFRIR